MRSAAGGLPGTMGRWHSFRRGFPAVFARSSSSSADRQWAGADGYCAGHLVGYRWSPTRRPKWPDLSIPVSTILGMRQEFFAFDGSVMMRSCRGELQKEPDLIQIRHVPAGKVCEALSGAGLASPPVPVGIVDARRTATESAASMAGACQWHEGEKDVQIEARAKEAFDGKNWSSRRNQRTKNGR